MKSLTRTIIFLVVLTLTMGDFVPAQAEGQAEPTARRQAPVPAPPEPSPLMPTIPAPVLETPVPPAPPAPSPYPTQPKSTGHISSRKVLVIPDSDVKPEEINAITQDLLVMSHILDERFKKSRTIKGMFTDFGDFFGRDNRSTEATYLQSYGVLFLMEVNFTFSPPLKPEEQEDEETTENIDPTWQRAREQLFSPQAPMPSFSEQEPGLVKFDQLKKEIIETLKHAANIRNITPDEWIIVTVIGHGRQPSEFYEDYYRSATTRSRTSRDRRSSRRSRPSRGEAEAGAYGGGMIGGMSMGMGGMAGMGGMTGMGGYGGGMMGGMAGYGEMSLPSATVLTIRAKKTDVDDFAKDELDFEEFQETVEIFTY